ncbi:DNA methyltransferase [Candidatus Lokiarchaeum ossiferum]|uniref:DNA methyltransferase n=1 Tax=Candidatus Lokiarchaeum ossiferum TaxID=2951803 RepID=UPI00352E4C43
MAHEKKEDIISDLEQDYIILPKTHSSMYLMHKYWARKPANIVSSYINRYCPPNGIVLDPFLGSGVTVLESIFAGRKAIGIDINPMSQFICKNSGIRVDLKKMQDCFTFLQIQIVENSSLYHDLFQFNCPICGQSAILTHLIRKNDGLEKVDEIEEVRYQCSKCKEIIVNSSQKASYLEKTFTTILEREKFAQNLINTKRINPPLFNFKYTNEVPFLQLRHNLRSNNGLDMLFSKRNLVFLTYLRDMIINLPTPFTDLSEIFMFVFSSAIGQASKMVWVIDKRNGKKLKKKQVGSWTHHFFWDPSSYFEVNPWNCFCERFKKIIRGKNDSNQRNLQSSLKFSLADSFSTLSVETPVFLLNISSSSLPIPDASIDFIFTDPPYGDSIQYGELSSLWGAWLNMNMEKFISQIEAEEIVINSKQGKKIDFYQDRLTQVFSEMHRVLKPECFMVITFHNTSLKIRNALISSVVNSSFLLKQILFQLPPRVSIKSMLHYNGSPIGDYYIRFQKPKNHEDYPTQRKNSQKKFSDEQIINKISTCIQKILFHRGEPTSFIWISNLIDEFLFEQGLFPMENLEKFMGLVKKLPIFSINEENVWWFADKSMVNNCEIALTEKITHFLKKMDFTRFKKSGKSSKKQEIFNLIYQHFRGVYTPDKFLVNQLIQGIN